MAGAASGPGTVHPFQVHAFPSITGIWSNAVFGSVSTAMTGMKTRSPWTGTEQTRADGEKTTRPHPRRAMQCAAPENQKPRRSGVLVRLAE